MIFKERKINFLIWPVRLYAIGLPAQISVPQRHARAKSYFVPDRLAGCVENTTAHELAMNPDVFTEQSDELTLSTLVHEAFSGGAAAFTAAVQFLNQNGRTDVTQRINNITYISPGALGDLYHNSNTIVLLGGTDPTDIAATSLTGFGTFNVQQASECGHNFACIAGHFKDLLASRMGSPCTFPTIINQRPYNFFDPFAFYRPNPSSFDESGQFFYEPIPFVQSRFIPD